MQRTIVPAPVRKSVRVNAPQRRAFEVFTDRIGQWWPKSHHISPSEPETYVVEPHEGCGVKPAQAARRICRGCWRA